MKEQLIPSDSKSGKNSSRRQLARQQALGLVLLAALVLLASLMRARWSEIFPLGWWRW
jgi:hypothetical protein